LRVAVIMRWERHELEGSAYLKWEELPILAGPAHCELVLADREGLQVDGGLKRRDLASEVRITTGRCPGYRAGIPDLQFIR
jgi:hypothetical protein